MNQESNARSLKKPLLFLFILEHCKNPRLLSCAFPFVFILFFVILIWLRSSIGITPGQTAATVHKISKLATSELRTLYAKNKGDGIHEIRLARAIGTDDGGEIPEWANDLVSPVGRFRDVEYRESSTDLYDLKSHNSMRIRGIFKPTLAGRTHTLK
jgi:hypothetical protein